MADRPSHTYPCRVCGRHLNSLVSCPFNFVDCSELQHGTMGRSCVDNFIFILNPNDINKRVAATSWEDYEGSSFSNWFP